MKRVIKSSFNAPSVYEALSLITSDSIQRRVYGKFMNTVEEHSEAYLQGVLDFAEISNHELSGIEMLWNLIQSEGVAEVRSQCVNTMKRVIRESRKHYFGDEESAKYGDLIAEKLSGKTVSKRSDTAEEPGGLIYEANKLGIDMWDLLRALEGMCYEGRARAIDDSTYIVATVDYNKPIVSGRATNRPRGKQKTYSDIRFSGWSVNLDNIRHGIRDALNDPAQTFPMPNQESKQIKVDIRLAISEAEAAEQRLNEYRSILETLNRSSFDRNDLSVALQDLMNFKFSQKDLHR